MIKSKLLWGTVLITALFSSCERSVDESTQDSEKSSKTISSSDKTSINESSSDYSWDVASQDSILLNGTSITTTNSNVTIDGTIATITSAGNYYISGTLSDGQIYVDTDSDSTIRLILSGVDMSCSDNAPIYVENAEKVVIALVSGTKNSVSDGSSYSSDEEDANAAIFSKDDLTIFGEGSLTVQGNYNDGIASKDGLVIASGTINVTAVDDGIRGKDYLYIKDGDITVEAEGDGLKSDNEDSDKGYITIDDGTLDITSDGDGIQAETELLITYGNISITAGGGSNQAIDEETSAKGIKSGIYTEINGGTITVNSADDAIHSSESIEINAGTISLASGDDGIHADADLTINEGYIEVTECYEGIESDLGDLTVNGGTIYVTAEDDGFNLSAGGSNEGGPGGGMGNSDSDSDSEYCLYLNGGYIVVDADGDGIDSNEDMEITGGTILVNGPTNGGNGAIDHDGTCLANGGLLVAAGSSSMIESPSESSTQYSVVVIFDATNDAGTLFHIETSDGEEIVTFSPSKTYQAVILTSELFENGGSYVVYYGGSYSGNESDGLYSDGTYTAGTEFSTFTISSMVTTVGESNSNPGNGNPGNGGPGGPGH